MSRDELRPCIVELVKVPFGGSVIKNGKEPEKHNAYFHTWENASNDNYSQVFGIVEYEDGTMHRVEPECITFTDRIFNVNIDIDEITKSVIKQMKVYDLSGRKSSIFL